MAEQFMPFCPPRFTTTPAGALSQLPPNPPSGAAAQIFSPLSAPVAAQPRTAHDESHTASPTDTSPKITLQRDGERVAQIRIQCGCGHVIDLECEY
ncbi:MAG: hypothetical protein HY043_06765 [Verrucomicrobia bacterium]|nr:hypothetical protein [Verrucomicrobiota bacterium]